MPEWQRILLMSGKHNKCHSRTIIAANCHCSMISLLPLLLPLLFAIPTKTQWAPQQMPSSRLIQPFPPHLRLEPTQMAQLPMLTSTVLPPFMQSSVQQIPQSPKFRPSHFEPMLKVKSQDGYLPASAGPGTFVRIAPSVHAPPLQILVEDRDLQPGMPSAVYQYVLTGYGAERFAVDQHGNLYLADLLDIEGGGAASASSFVLHVMAREVDTEPRRESPPISVTVHLMDDDHLAPVTSLAPTIYIANVSALAPGERVIAQVKAREGDGAGPVQYRIVEVSDGASASFRYDELTNELRAVGPLYPGHRYKVVIEARDADGLVGHAIVLVQALAPLLPLGTLTAFLPTKPDSPNQIALLPAQVVGHGRVPVVPPVAENPPFALNTVQPMEQNIFVEVSELAPVGTLITSLGDAHSKDSVRFLLAGKPDDQVHFMVEPDNGNVLIQKQLDREKTDHHLLRIEAHSPGNIHGKPLYVTNVHVRVLDVNDNAPQFMGPFPLLLSTRLEELSPSAVQFTQPNLLLGHVRVLDPDQGDNGRVRLRVLPPLDRLFTINDAGEVRVNGLLTATHLGEHHLTVMAEDGGNPPQESRAVISVRINGLFAAGVRETLLGVLPPAIGGLPTFGLTLPAGQQPQSAASSGSATSSADYESLDKTGPESGGGQDEQMHSIGEEAQRRLPAPAGGPPPFTRVEPRLGNVLPAVVQPTTVTNISPFPIVEPTAAMTQFKPPSSTESPSTHSPATSAIPVEEHTKESKTTGKVVQSPPPPAVQPVERPPQLSPSPLPAQLPTRIPSKSQGSSASAEEPGEPRLAPIFESAAVKLFVEENEEHMELTRLHARWPDDGPGVIEYLLLAGDQSLFSVNSTNGQVMLLKALDAESEQQPPVYRLLVGTAQAQSRDGHFLTDQELAHSCELTVHVMDTNDWIPNFEQEHYEFGIPATAEAGTVLGQVTAFDQDLTAPNNKVEYRLLSPKDSSLADGSALFKIGSDSGQIVLQAPSLAEFAGSRLVFRVQALDGGLDGTELNSTVSVTVHVEGIRNKPKLLPLPPKETGENGRQIETETPPLPSMAITTAPQTSSMPTRPPPLASHPSVGAIQFASRQFNGTVMEGARPPQLVLTLEVRNKPRDTRFTICAIRAGNYRSAFSVAPNAAGDCELRTQMQLDREALPNYRLNISVENGGQMDWAITEVSVLDVNDNKPRFLFPSGGDAPTSTFFAVLPIETAACENFFKVKAEDGDAPGTGNSLISFELDNQTTAGDANYFGVDSKSGDIWPRKKARELAQLSRRNYFRLTVIACDNPGEPKRRLCSRAPVAISLLDDQHRFTLVFLGISPEQVKRHEKDLIHSLLPFIANCANPVTERIEEKQVGSANNGQSTVSVHMYAANLKEHKLCLRQEFHKLFANEARDSLTAAMRQWGAELVEVIGDSKSFRPNGNAAETTAADGDFGGVAALFFPIDWSNASTVLIAIAVGVVLIALVGLCALFLFRARHKQMRRRAEQMRRRHHQHRSVFNATGLLAVNGAKCQSTAAPMNGIFSGLPSSYAASSNVSNNLYLPAAATPLGSAHGGGCGVFERGNKFYESQMLELPIGDGDEFISRSNHQQLANANGGANFWRPNGGMNGHCNGHTNHHQNQRNNEGIGTAQNESSSAKSSPNRRHYSSGLLPAPPPPSSQRQQQQCNNTRLNNNAFPACPPGTSGAAVLRRHHSPSSGAVEDFSIDESLYAANGQARYLY